MSDGDVAYVECLQAQEAAYWEARRRGMHLTDKQIGDLLRAAAPELTRELRAWRDASLPIIATLAIYGERADIPSLVELARELNHAEKGAPA